MSGEWRELAAFAQIITSIPATEVENEPLFGVKINMIEKLCTRIEPDLLAAWKK